MISINIIVLCQKVIRIHPTNGSKVSVHLYGGTILSYIVNDHEHLFVSKDAILDGTKPIRGGIPLVFPIFGPPSTFNNDTMPQHGFARRNIWNIKKEICINDDDDDDIYVSMILELIVNRDMISTDSVGCNNIWSTFNDYIQCTLYYLIELHKNKLLTTLNVTNTGTLPFDYQALFHTYYKCYDDAMDPKFVYVKGLHNYQCIDDKVIPNKYYNMIQNDDNDNNYITISSKEVDRIYNPTYLDPNDQYLDVTIGVGKNVTVRMTTAGTILVSESIPDDEPVRITKLPISCVIWNPYKEKAASMTDFDDNEYHNMICVEPGMLYTNINDRSNMIFLQPNHTGILQQTIYAAVTTDERNKDVD